MREQLEHEGGDQDIEFDGKLRLSRELERTLGDRKQIRILGVFERTKPRDRGEGAGGAGGLETRRGPQRSAKQLCLRHHIE